MSVVCGVGIYCFGLERNLQLRQNSPRCWWSSSACMLRASSRAHAGVLDFVARTPQAADMAVSEAGARSAARTQCLASHCLQLQLHFRAAGEKHAVQRQGARQLRQHLPAAAACCIYIFKQEVAYIDSWVKKKVMRGAFCEGRSRGARGRGAFLEGR
jgi:hypothetical protein